MFSFRVKTLLALLLFLLPLWTSVRIVDSASLQLTPTATPFFQESDTSILDITFKEIGFEEEILHGPYAGLNQEFVVPDGWLIQAGSYVELNLSHISNILLKGQEDERYAILDILLDEHLLAQHLMQEPANQPFQVRVALPPDLLNQPESRSHSLSVRLDSSYVCDVEHRYDLTVYPDSMFHLEYQQLPAVPDLRNYPRLFYGATFKRDSVLFVLPQYPSQAEFGSAVAIAAKLGQSIGGQLIISATTEISMTQESAANSHLFIVGTPDNNEVISELTANGLLPVGVKPGEAQLSIQGPARFPDDGVLSYTVAVTNNTTTALDAPVLELILPPEASPQACGPDCESDENGVFYHPLPSLEAGQATALTVTLTFSRQLALPTVDTTVALVGPQRVPLNVVTWSTAVSDSVRPASHNLPHHFFVYAGRAVPEADGVVQEIISPWNSAKVAIVVSGATAEGVSKAGQALSNEVYFPGMSGQVAIVRGVEKAPSKRSISMANFTLADLDYEDQTVYGFGPKTLEFGFYVPPDWTLTDDAHAVIRFRHSADVDVGQASITVLVNDDPVRSVKLEKGDEKQEVLAVPLPESYILRGWNYLTFVANHESLEWCVEDYWTRGVWLTILNSSEIHLDHELTEPELDLSVFPLPYDSTPDLSDLLFALPDPPSIAESLAALRVAATLGNATEGDGFSPGVILGEPDEGVMTGKHVIAVGRPSVSPVIQKLNTALPQPFIQGTDYLLQTIDAVVFRIPLGAEVGYIEQIPSIWDPAKALLVVTGTSDVGVDWAAAALADSRLKGNLAVARGAEVHSADTRRPRGEEPILTSDIITPEPPTPLPAEERATPALEVRATATPLPPTPEATVVAAPQTPSSWERTRLGLAITALLLLTMVILGVIWWRKRRQRYW